ncbi:uncharacterized protein SPAPADRAFT_56192 [Spathaspora passalidarum NRRL Y-27907]|uniref:Stress response regulator protein 1 n=1 Tax=Spathaspora passalidarum (strain NRRL Y-27907 / 11-Y1) TaxID=619300 RepID=G3ARJ9_SPAPN|nr:uncharacterized protein SPAPADRAFT_56192 [Spathaspora passalidarum NRRL Y-27907]EGW31320.1 hypothetical protein SPAPADRAFT_56192 [Spathaspora passalidarum NRRL Y-27907]
MFGAEYFNPFQKILISSDTPISSSTQPINHNNSIPKRASFNIDHKLSIEITSEKSDENYTTPQPYNYDYQYITSHSTYSPITPEDLFPPPVINSYFPSEENVVIPQFSPYRFLVVDDNIVNLQILSRQLLKIFPYAEINQIQDSTKVKQLLDRNTFDVVFLDIEMPEVDGIELAQYMRCNEKFNQWGVIAVTTLTTTRDIQRYKQCGIDYTFKKPMNADLNHIARVVDEIIRQRKYGRFS